MKDKSPVWVACINESATDSHHIAVSVPRCTHRLLGDCDACVLGDSFTSSERPTGEDTPPVNLAGLHIDDAERRR